MTPASASSVWRRLKRLHRRQTTFSCPAVACFWFRLSPIIGRCRPRASMSARPTNPVAPATAITSDIILLPALGTELVEGDGLRSASRLLKRPPPAHFNRIVERVAAAPYAPRPPSLHRLVHSHMHRNDCVSAVFAYPPPASTAFTSNTARRDSGSMKEVGGA